ncbi:MAG: AMP-binding protein [Prevotella sp.]|nr:AMP-binding protein [Prevotella sp.]
MSLEEFYHQWNDSDPRLLVHTSGSTGAPKPLWVEKSRMRASARITCEFLQLEEGETALLCLPLDYIAGKMMAVRAWEWNLRLLAVIPDSHPMVALAQDYPEVSTIAFAAMIPMQVVRSLEDEKEAIALKKIKNLIIGGGAIDDTLAKTLRSFPNAVYSTYGMTETLSHVALRRLSGPEASLWYTPFNGVSISLDSDQRIVIDAPEVCAERLVTNDIGEMNVDGRRFRVLGRAGNVICSGGIKVQAEEVERLLADVISEPYFVTAIPDAVLGQVVTIVVQKEHRRELSESSTVDESPEQWLHRHHDTFVRLLPPYWCPRKALFVNRLPMTETGKIIRKIPSMFT